MSLESFHLKVLFTLLEDKLQTVEKQYIESLQTENQKWSSRTEKRLLELHRQWELKRKEMLNEEVIIKLIIIINLLLLLLLLLLLVLL